MAFVKISELPAASSAAGTDELEANQSGTSRKVTAAQLRDGLLPTSGGTLTGALAINTTSALTIPVGTTAQRPSGAAGELRFNTTTSNFEGHNGTEWGGLGSSGGQSPLPLFSMGIY